MNRSCLLLCLVLNFASAQNCPLCGTYVSGEFRLLITDSIMEFNATTGCCLLLDYYGRGTYYAHGDTLYLDATIPGKDKDSSYEFTDEILSENSFKVLINARDGQHCMCHVTIEDRVSGEIIYTASHDSVGRVMISDFETSIDVDNFDLQIHSFAFDDYRIPLSDISGKSVIITIADYKILRNESVYFMLDNQIEPTKISGPYFIISKEEKRELNRRKWRIIAKTIIRRWPWHWHFGDSHESMLTVFVKQYDSNNLNK